MDIRKTSVWSLARVVVPTSIRKSIRRLFYKDDVGSLFAPMYCPGQVIRFWNDISQLTTVGLRPKSLMCYMLELSFDFKFWRYIRNQFEKAFAVFDNPCLGGWLDSYAAGLLYATIRARKPEVVIETGVGPGSSTTIILNALKRNSKGILYSIDLPGNDAVIYPTIDRPYHIHVPTGFSPGWLVAPWLKNRWNLLLGDSREELPRLLSEIPSVDVFMHDSLHTDEQINFELSAILPLMPQGSLLLADDVNKYWTLAFTEFCATKCLPFAIFRNRLGIAVKTI